MDEAQIEWPETIGCLAAISRGLYEADPNLAITIAFTDCRDKALKALADASDTKAKRLAKITMTILIQDSE